MAVAVLVGPSNCLRRAGSSAEAALCPLRYEDYESVFRLLEDATAARLGRHTKHIGMPQLVIELHVSQAVVNHTKDK